MDGTSVQVPSQFLSREIRRNREIYVWNILWCRGDICGRNKLSFGSKRKNGNLPWVWSSRRPNQSKLFTTCMLFSTSLCVCIYVTVRLRVKSGLYLCTHDHSCPHCIQGRQDRLCWLRSTSQPKFDLSEQSDDIVALLLRKQSFFDVLMSL